MQIQDLAPLATFPFFSKETLKQLENKEQLLNFNLQYWIKNGKIIPIKRGLYLLKERWEKEENKENFLKLLANKLYEPSYLSLEYIMAKYALLTEGVYAFTSITTKKTKTLINDLGRFSYYSLTPKLFTGHTLQKFGSSFILEAKKEKALFDYLYLRFLKKTEINQKVITELRINWENINKSEFKTIKSYASLSDNPRINKLIVEIERLHYAL